MPATCSTDKVEVSKGKNPSADKHSPVPNAAIMLRKPTSVSVIWAPLVSPSSWTILMRHTPIDVKTRQRMNRMAHQVAETHLRVPLETATPRFGKIPSADGIECSEERSDVNTGPAIEHALALSSSEVGDRRRVPDAVVSIYNREKGVTHSPRQLAACTLPGSAPSTLSIPPTHVVPHCQPLDDQIPRIQVVSRRREVNFINRLDVSIKPCSPSLETTRKWSDTTVTHTSSEKGGQLARAATYIRERLLRRSSAFDKFVRRTPKALPDKTMEPDTQQHSLNVVSENAYTCARLSFQWRARCSPNRNLRLCHHSLTGR